MKFEGPVLNCRGQYSHRCEYLNEFMKFGTMYLQFSKSFLTDVVNRIRPVVVQQISTNVSSSGIYFYIYCENDYFSFCTRTVTCRTKTEKWVCTTGDRPGTNAEIINYNLSGFVPPVTVLAQKLK
jgi:hypothetical protein